MSQEGLRAGLTALGIDPARVPLTPGAVNLTPRVIDGGGHGDTLTGEWVLSVDLIITDAEVAGLLTTDRPDGHTLWTAKADGTGWDVRPLHETLPGLQ